MACMTLFVQPLAMATTQLARVVQYEEASTTHLEVKVERSPLRMSWGRGHRRRSKAAPAYALGFRLLNLATACNIAVTNCA